MFAITYSIRSPPLSLCQDVLLKRMKNTGVQPNSEIYAYVATAYVRDGLFQQASSSHLLGPVIFDEGVNNTCQVDHCLVMS